MRLIYTMACVGLSFCKKSVSFSADCKGYDGPKTTYNVLYADILNTFLNGGLKTKEDILGYCGYDRDFIDFCIREAIITKSKFPELRKKEQEYYRDYRKRILLEEDPYFVEKIKLRPGIPPVRMGLSNRNTNFKLHLEDFSKICIFIELLHSADEYIFFKCNK